MFGTVPVTYDDIVILSEIVIAQSSDPQEDDKVGVLNKDNIRNCCDLLTNYFYDDEQVQGLVNKAAELLDCIVRSHGLISANKRTSIAAVNLFLHRNGWIYRPDNKTVSMTMRSAKKEVSINELETWIRSCSIPKTL